MEDVVNLSFHKQEIRHVVLDKSKPWIPEQMGNVGGVPGDEVVDANDGVVLRNESITKMGT